MALEGGFYTKTDFPDLSKDRLISLLLNQKFTAEEIDLLKKNGVV
jgi:hypothetical protein